MKDHYTFSNEGINERIDKFITEKVTDASRSQIQSLIKEGHITVNGSSVKSNYKVQSEDIIEVNIPEPEVIDAKPEDISIEIIYEDQDVLVVNKPQGMVVHPSIGHSSGTLVNALLYHIKDLSGIKGKIRPGIVHRIDKDTSGLLMIAKNDVAHEKLSEQLKEKKAQREYIALVHGLIHHDKGTIDAPIGRDSSNRKKYAVVDNGKPSVTHFEVIERFNKFTLIKLILETGRTHQIRVHMDYIEHPLAGDPIYGPRKTIKGNGQFLHAETLGFTHPTTGEEMKFSSPIPEIFQETIEILRKQ
ncbi:23S rRNA pseudouridine1911/1915/1917 synthase [Marinilactibacillus piezotolerans]|uniref:Pseudouridine synthase n=1 Tax=Marinilactibacillus piezotolerans TaxID=258723 RepID=A0A1I3YQ98_9LACT|nr:RluA family pseudouridine synthase [Marinilactibacillus piezotolerans]SFK34012.1 23S rRNA pseudouridine1911/1915/1917 synthase [Marinilactibacillus piezotolerans]